MATDPATPTPTPQSTSQSTPQVMPASEPSTAALIAALKADRLWLLRQIDAGRWPEWRLDLAALERELGQLLDQVDERHPSGDSGASA